MANEKDAKQGAHERIVNFQEVVTPNPDSFEVICQRLAAGETLKEICRSWNLPHGRMIFWFISDDRRYEIYKRAIAEGIRARIDAPTPNGGAI